MPLKESEAIVLRTYPLREADLLVTLFTRLEGKVRGVARAAKKSKRRFGGALEPLTYVRVYYEDRERQELTRLDSCDVIESPLATEVGYPRAVGLGHIAELLDELLPDREATDAPVAAVAVAWGAVGAPERPTKRPSSRCRTRSRVRSSSWPIASSVQGSPSKPNRSSRP